ncbi:MAG: GAF domain-containing protein, partial [Myxococcota bacterium]
EARALGLAPGASWMLSVRDEVAGVSLDALDAQELGERWPRLARSVVARLRDLHEVGIVHADLQPRNVVLAPSGQTWLIDLPLFSTSPGERGHIVGSAPFMAPELWAGAPPSGAADLYALGALICWIAGGRVHAWAAHTLTEWARAHRDVEPALPGVLGDRLGPVVRRLMHRHPAQRPGPQAVLDVLDDVFLEGEGIQDTEILTSMDPHQQVVDALLERVQRGARSGAWVLHAPPRAGKTRAIRSLAGRIEVLGRPVVMLRGADLAARAHALMTHLHPKTHDGPWRALLDLIDLCMRRFHSQPAPSLRPGRGDRLHTFEALERALLESAPPEGLVVVWDDLDAVSPDVLMWLRHILGRSGELDRGPAIQWIFATRDPALLPEAHPVALPQPDARAWERWRAVTLRAEVRDISSGIWAQILEDHGASIGRVLGALEQELGGVVARAEREREDEASALPRAEALRALIARHGAFVEAAWGCARVAASGEAATNPDEFAQVLDVWVDAVSRAGGSDTRAEELSRVLDELDLGDDTRLAVWRARLAHALGKHADGIAAMDGLEELDESHPDFARVRMWHAQLLLSSGALKEAGELAQRALTALAVPADFCARVQRAPNFPEIAQLAVVCHGARAIPGNRAAIDALRQLAPFLEEPRIEASLRARCHAYAALGHTRLDEHQDATDAYLRALEEVERAGLDTDLPIYLLNVGTGYHKQGRLGLAREYYARGARVAQPSTRASSRALLFVNQASIDVTLGRLDEAMAMVRRGRHIAQEHGLAAIDAFGTTVEGEVLQRRGDAEEAMAVWTKAMQTHAAAITPQRRVELLLHQSAVHLDREDVRAARRTLDEARALIEEHDLKIPRSYHGVLRARLEWMDGDTVGTMAGIELFRRSLLSAAQASNHSLVLEHSPVLWEKLHREGLVKLQEELRELVGRTRNAVASGLGRELREEFFRNLPSLPEPSPETPATLLASAPAVRGLAPPARQPAGSVPVARDEIIERFYRMLSLNEVILKTSSRAELYDRALEIALSLSGAERGFLLMHREDGAQSFEIVASRDLGGDRIPEPHLKVSLTIAQEAAETGHTVVTINAREDERFNAALSVVDLDLSSVLCVPVRDATGLLGALYLDHRFHPGVFHAELQRMMESFGHQLALGLTNAERRETLERERQELAAARDDLDALLSEREAMLAGLERRVAQLSDEVARKQADQTLARPNFPDIAYASRVMEDVLRRVERIGRSDIPVVLRGESGTGKELVARALH